MKKNTKNTNKNEELKVITEKLEAGITELFESGRFEEYLQMMGRFHRYSVNNCILILLQKPEATLVAGYRKWQDEFNRQVKRGERSIKILAPMTRKAKRVEKNPVTGEEEEKEVTFTVYRPVPVFDISQTEGDDLPDIVTQLEGDEGAELIAKVEKVSPVPVRYEPIRGTANGYFHQDGYIVVDDGLSPKQTLKTLIHEVAHATIHCKDGEEVEADRATKEVQAEAVAYTVCNFFGVDTSDYSFGYVAGWSYGKDKDELRKNLEVIRKTAGTIIDSVTAAAVKEAA